MYHFMFLINILSRQAFSTAKGIFLKKNKREGSRINCRCVL